MENNKSHVVQRNCSAGSQQFQAHLIVVVVVLLIGVNKYKIKRARFATIQQLLYNVVTPTT